MKPVLGDDIISKAVDPCNNAISRVLDSTCIPSVMSDVIDMADKASRGISTFLVEPSAGLGKAFAPLSGNWHRTTGLTQRNSVMQERTTLSQAKLAIFTSLEGATHR